MFEWWIQEQHIYIYIHTYIDIYTQSTHPRLTKRLIVYRQTLIVSRACFQEKAYKSYFNEMKSSFLKHSYLEHLIDTEYLIQEKELKKVNLKRYHLEWLLICHWIFSTKSLHLLNMNGEVKNVLFLGPMVSIRVRLSQVAILWGPHYTHSTVT